MGSAGLTDMLLHWYPENVTKSDSREKQDLLRQNSERSAAYLALPILGIRILTSLLGTGRRSFDLGLGKNAWRYALKSELYSLLCTIM